MTVVGTMNAMTTYRARVARCGSFKNCPPMLFYSMEELRYFRNSSSELLNSDGLSR